MRRAVAETARWAVAVAIGLGSAAALQAGNGSQAPELQAPIEGPTFAEAQTLFYNARYEAAAAMTLALQSAQPDDLALDELRTSALLFQLKALLEGPDDKTVDRKEADKKEALKKCATCPQLMAAFFEDISRGQNKARALLRANPSDESALFFLGKLDLNYVWLQLGPLGRKTGWDEYWEARRSLDAVLKKRPTHVRALVARAWIDYIVDTKMPWGTKWLLGGGSRKRAMTAVRAAAQIESDFFSHTEAEFALWHMRVREREMAQATEAARRLAQDFPNNRELATFLEARDGGARR